MSTGRPILPPRILGYRPHVDSNAVVVAVATLVAVVTGVLVSEAPMFAVGLAVGVSLLALSAQRADAVFAALLASALVLPAFVGFAAWIPLLALTLLVGLVRAVSAERPIIVPAGIAAYAMVYMLAVVYNGPSEVDGLSLAKYLAPPGLAVVTFWAAADASVRRRLLLMIVAVGIAQVPVTLVQGITEIRAGTVGGLSDPDAVTGLLGLYGSGSLALVEAAIATVLVALVMAGVTRPKLVLAAAAALCVVPVVASVRAVAFFLLAGLGGALLGAWRHRHREIARRRTVLVLGLMLVTIPGSFVAVQVLYSSPNNPLRNADTVAQYLRGGGGPQPNRAAQIELAADIVSKRGLETVLFGEGIGATVADVGEIRSSRPIATLTAEQKTSGVWDARLLVETGVVGVLTLLFFLIWLARVNPRVGTTARGIDLALVISLPGLAALAFVATLYTTALASQPFATVFWMLVGLGLAAAQSPSGMGVRHPRDSVA